MVEFTCKKCEHTAYELREKGTQIGLYCAKCGRWHKWVDKKEVYRYGTPEPTEAMPEILIINGVKYRKETK